MQIKLITLIKCYDLILLQLKQNNANQYYNNIGILAHIHLIGCGGRGEKEINMAVTLTDPI